MDSEHARAACRALSAIIKPFDLEVIRAAIRNEVTLFDAVSPLPADGDRALSSRALVAGARSVIFLAMYLPVGDALRDQIAAFAERLSGRLEQPDALLLAGAGGDGRLPPLEGSPYRPPKEIGGLWDHWIDDGVVVGTDEYLFLRPAQITRL